MTIDLIRRRLNNLRRKRPGDIALVSRVGIVRKNLLLLKRGGGGVGLPRVTLSNIAGLADYLKASESAVR
jgi:hypothetical protein